MPKKGFLDSVMHDVNDYNCDGEVDALDELQYWEDIESEEKREQDRLAHHDWQLYCEDGAEYGLDPYDFDDEGKLYRHSLRLYESKNADDMKKLKKNIVDAYSKQYGSYTTENWSTQEGTMSYEWKSGNIIVEIVMWNDGDITIYYKLASALW